MTDLYKETASGRVSLSSFSWREVVVRAPAALRGSGSSGGGGGGLETRSRSDQAGGFSYRESAHLTSPCRNRAILWHYQEDALRLLEVSMDTSLVHNALKLLLTDGGPLLPSVSIHELGASNVVVLFATSSAVFRLVLPHPEAVLKDPSLSVVGDGRQPSILAFAGNDSLLHSNTAAVFSQPTNALPVSSFAGWITRSGHTTFALSSPCGPILLVQLQPPGTHGLPIRSELKETSVMHKLWSMIPSAMRGRADSEEAAASIAIHVFSGETVVLALCHDLSFKLWSCEQAQCIMTYSLSQYLQEEPSSEVTGSKVEGLLLRKAPNGTTSSLRFGVHMKVGGASQVSLFQLLLVQSQLTLHHLQSYPCPGPAPTPATAELVDFRLSNRDVCGVWVCRGEGGEEVTLVRRAVYEGDAATSWVGVALSQAPPQEIAIPPHKEPKEAYLDVLLFPGRFSTMAICKALELYGAGGLWECSLTELSRKASARVEQELHPSEGSCELSHDQYHAQSVKCWEKFYGCCFEYQQLLSRPLGLFQDPGTGLTCLVKAGAYSFLQPAPLAECLSLAVGDAPSDYRDGRFGEEVSLFLTCVKEVTAQLSGEVLESFLDSLGREEPVSMAMELANSLLEEVDDGDRCEAITAAVELCLSSVQDLCAVLVRLLSLLDPASTVTSGNRDEEEEGGGDSDDPEDAMELQLIASQLFASPVAVAILGSSLQEGCALRLSLCRDVLLSLCVLFAMQQTGTMQLPSAISASFIPSFTALLQGYHCLHWLLSRTPHPASASTFESNLKQLAALEISAGGRGLHQAPPTSSPAHSLGELYLSSPQGRQELVRGLTRGRVLPSDVPFHQHWTVLLPEMVSILTRLLWPLTSACSVCEFLLSQCQYTYLQEYVCLLEPFVPEGGRCSLHFLLGQSLLCCGEMEKACRCFVMAAEGVFDEPLLRGVAGVGGEGGEEEGEGSEGGEGLGQYYVRVMRLFEQVSSPSFVIKIAEIATKKVDKEDPNAAVLWSTLFKYHLELGHSQEAYAAMMQNPDPVRQRECLGLLVVVLTEQRRLKELCHFSYAGLEDEVERVIEDRARRVDVTKHNYYHLLYCFYTTRANYRKAAYVMYEQALRLGREAVGVGYLQKQANCYCVALTALRITEPRYAWVVRPVDLEETIVTGNKLSNRKRPNPSQKVLKRRVEVLTLADIEKEYLLVLAKLKLLARDPSLAGKLASPFVSAEEVTALLVQVGLFETAIATANQHGVSLKPIFEALAARCVHLSANVVAFRQGAADRTTSWEWLAMNETACATTARENSVADKAWSLLRTLLEKHDPANNHTLQHCVARKLITMGTPLPQWMIEVYKATNPAELLKLYLTFDLLEPAASLAVEYIDAALGHGKEWFGLSSGLHATSPSVWLPHSVLDHLQLALREAGESSCLKQVSEQLDAKLGQYLQEVGSVSRSMKQQHASRHTHL